MIAIPFLLSGLFGSGVGLGFLLKQKELKTVVIEVEKLKLSITLPEDKLTVQ